MCDERDTIYECLVRNHFRKPAKTTKAEIRKAKIIIRQIDTLWYPLLYRSLSCQWTGYKYQP